MKVLQYTTRTVINSGTLVKGQQTLFRCLSVFLGFILVQPAYSQGISEDPFIGFNRTVYSVNELMDDYLIKPVTESYDAVMPRFAKRGVSNFFNNLDDVNVIVNDIFQLKLQNAFYDSGRIIINTTVGVGGFIDIASGFGLYKNYEDFGQTMGRWGVESGPYLVLPMLGSSSVRDVVGLVPDLFFNPVFWIVDSKTRGGVYAMDTIDTRLSYLAAESMISGDEYTFVRDAYVQRREYQVADGQVYDEFDDY